MILDYNIIKEFIPIDDKSSFLIMKCEVRGEIIFAAYKMVDGPFDVKSPHMNEEFNWERTAPIPISMYIKEKRERDLKKIIN